MAKKIDDQTNGAVAPEPQAEQVAPQPQPAPEIKLLPLPEGNPDVYPGLILQLIPKVIGEIASIGKDKVNAQQGFAYRSVDDIYNVLNPVIARYGITVVLKVKKAEYSQGISKNKAEYTRCLMDICYRFYAPDGSYISVDISQEAHDYADKASSKALSNGLKYACFQTFLIPTIGNVESDQAHIEQNNRAVAEQAAQEAEHARQQAVEAARVACKPVIAEIGELMNDPNMIWPEHIKDTFRARLKGAGLNIEKISKIRDDIKAKMKELDGVPAQETAPA